MDDEPKADVITPRDPQNKKVKPGGPRAADSGTLGRGEA